MNVLVSSYQEMVARFKKIKKIGAGSYGDVYLIREIKTYNEFALKVIPLSKLNNGKPHDLIAYEKINQHPNIVTLYSKFSDQTNFYQIFEYCPEGDLANYINTHGLLSIEDAVDVFRQIVEAVHYLHSIGVAHLDLKPENILVSKFPIVKVGDFGLSHIFSPGEKISEFCGTMHFSAPECLCNIKYDAPKADIWSLGIILYYLIVGKTPWTSNDRNIMMKQIVSGYVFIPEYLIRSEIDLLRQILKVNPTERISTESILFHPFMTIRRSSTQIRQKSKSPISMPSIRSSRKIFSPSVKQYTFE